MEQAKRQYLPLRSGVADEDLELTEIGSEWKREKLT
jgi:hypothetical protein